MPALEYVSATLDHAAAMAPLVQQADRAEMWALARLTPAFALRMSVAQSDRAVTVLEDGAPIVMMGVGPRSVITNTGTPWLLATERAVSSPRRFLAECKKGFASVIAGYSHLENVVDQRHETSMRWLRWLGFTIHDAEPMGIDGLPFHRFTKDV